MDKLHSFFLFCSGVDRDLLNQTKTEINKYAGIGATVFFTGIFAFIASSYALYTVFDNWIPALVFGIVWGLMIFNLDRYIVSSMKKKGSIWRDFGMALPRIILAVIISIVIAKPLELKIFDSEIQAELISMQQEQRKVHEDKLKVRFDDDLKKVDEEIGELNSDLKRLQTAKLTAAAEALSEADGTGGSKIRNMGPIYKAKVLAAKQLEDEYTIKNTALAPKLLTLETRKKQLLDTRDAELVALEKASLTGFASRIEALDRVGRKSEAVWLASIFIMLLFIAIETSPLFVKLISDRAPYDYVLDKIEVDIEMDHKDYTTRRKLNTQIDLDFERKTKIFRNQKEIEAENELFGHAIAHEVDDIKRSTLGIKDYLAKGRIVKA